MLKAPVRPQHNWNLSIMARCECCDAYQSTLEGMCPSCHDSAYLTEWQNYAKELELSPVLLEIANERRRQIEDEGWTQEHDDQHSSGELAGAAGCYAKHVNARQWCFKSAPDDYQCEPVPSSWPWDSEWWKPKNPRSDLVRAAALIVAELERLDRGEKC